MVYEWLHYKWCYTINPDEGTSFEISVLIIILNYSLILYCRCIVIWILMVVDGLFSRGGWMDQLTFNLIGLIMRKVLVISMENSGWDWVRYYLNLFSKSRWCSSLASRFFASAFIMGRGRAAPSQCKNGLRRKLCLPD